MTSSSTKHPFRELPEFSPELRAECAARKDGFPYMFELVKHVAIVAHESALLDGTPDAVTHFPEVQHAVYRGLLHRSARLLQSVAFLARNDGFEETLRVIVRSIVETSVKLSWLCAGERESRLVRYLADGLRVERELQTEIAANTEARGGAPLVIERRMLESVERCIRLTGLSEDELTLAKRLPNVDSMLRQLGSSPFIYTSFYRMSSHAVHGTWVDLLFCYLTHDLEHGFRVADTPKSPRVETLMLGCLAVSDALSDYFVAFVRHPQLLDAAQGAVSQIRAAVLQAQGIGHEGDFDEAK